MILTGNEYPGVRGVSAPPPPRETLLSDVLKGLVSREGLEVEASDTVAAFHTQFKRARSGAGSLLASTAELGLRRRGPLAMQDPLNHCSSSLRLLRLCFSFDANETPVCRIALTLLSCCEGAGETIILHINSS